MPDVKLGYRHPEVPTWKNPPKPDSGFRAPRRESAFLITFHRNQFTIQHQGELNYLQTRLFY